MSSFVWTYAFSYLGHIPRSMLRSLCRDRVDLHPKFGLHVKTDVATHIPRGYEKYYSNEAFRAEQGRPPKLARKLLKGERKEGWLRVFILWLESRARVMCPHKGRRLSSLNLPTVRKEGVLELLYQFGQIWSPRKREGGDLKAVSRQTSKNGVRSYYRVELLDGMVILCSAFWGTVKLFSTVAAPSYTTTSSVGELHLFHILTFIIIIIIIIIL